MDSNSSSVPAFLTKLWKLVDNKNYDHLIYWGQNGKSFIIHDQTVFSRELLPLYFKHNNMASFIRQLNMYGFRKQPHIENSGLRAERDDVEFYHPCFVKGNEHALEYIKRKISTNKGGTIEKLKNNEVKEFLTDMETIKGKQESVDSLLSNLKKENEILWREVALLRQKHHKQQQIVEKLIQFLVGLVHNPRNVLLGLKRNNLLMLNGAESGEPAYKKSKRGPIINDVTDLLHEDLSSIENANSPIISDLNTDELSPMPEINPPEDSVQIFNDNLLGNTLNPTDLLQNLDPLQASIKSAEIEDLIAQDDSIGEILQTNDNSQKSPSPLNTPPSSPGLITKDSRTSKPNNQTTDLVVSSINTPSLSPTSITNHLNNHVDGIETELDWLQEQLGSGELNLDSQTLLGLFSLDDSCLANVLPSVTNADSNALDDPSNISIPEEFDFDNLTSLEGSKLDSSQSDILTTTNGE